MNNKEKNQVESLEVSIPDGNKEDTKSIEPLFPKDMRTDEIKNEINDIKKWENKIKQKDLKYETNRYKFDF